MKQFILMSDIIDSSSKSQNILMENFKKAVYYVNEKYMKELNSPFTITLGDEFQGLVKDLRTSLNAIVDLEEYIIENNFGFKLRYVLVYGEVETNINTKIAFEMLGKGLTYARNSLNRLSSEHERFFVDIEHTSKNVILNHTFAIYQGIVDKWNLKNDSALISSFIRNIDYKEVSKDLNKNRSLIWKRGKTLNISSYFSTKEILKATAEI